MIAFPQHEELNCSPEKKYTIPIDDYIKLIHILYNNNI